MSGLLYGLLVTKKTAQQNALPQIADICCFTKPPGQIEDSRLIQRNLTTQLPRAAFPVAEAGSKLQYSILRMTCTTRIHWEGRMSTEIGKHLGYLRIGKDLGHSHPLEHPSPCM